MTLRVLTGRLARRVRDERGVLVYLALVLVNTAWNARRLVTLRPGDRPAHVPAVAVLVPARNESATIGGCVGSLLAQEWPRLRVFVLDDHSTDGTRDVLDGFRGDPRLCVLEGRPLPAGWLGKPWACAQLAEAAEEAELLIFVDADTRHGPGMVAAVAAAMEREQLDMLSIVPGQEMGGPWERWTVPIIPWALLTHLSPAAAQVAGITPGAGAVGQVLAFRRGAYARLGGHGAVRAAVAEDVALARLATRHRLRLRLAAGWRVSRCRMYPSRREAFAGLEKNLFPALGGRTVPFLLAWAWLLRAFAAPPLLAALRLTRGEFRQAAAPAGAAGMGFVSWLLVARALGLPRRTVLEGPVIVTVGSALAVRSWLAWKTGQATWKGRRLGAGGS
jgi:chlorobactene glucosyltransferase